MMTILIFGWTVPLTAPDIPLPVRCHLDQSPLSSKPQIITGILKMEEENNKGEAI